MFFQSVNFNNNSVQDANGRIDEQIDKFTGAQASAAGLTWSYANILHALHVREQVQQFIKDLQISFVKLDIK